MSYKQEVIAKLAQEILAAGYRVFLAKSGEYGFYTDAEGTRVVSFQYGLCGGAEYSGNYKTEHPSQNGSGWGMYTASFDDMFRATPHVRVHGWWRYTTLAEHLNSYGSSSGYTEIVAANHEPV